MEITPEPTEDEVAAITAAVNVALTPSGTSDSSEKKSRWRFSGRWWAQPVAARRGRP